ncbi:eukaryotic cytochrome b561-domain-containing protein [Kalaharituber pfeilii]|nr:eukaryotic cytochrome b561-domain-containing protein [Kalaharituber pfeilii]
MTGFMFRLATRGHKGGSWWMSMRAVCREDCVSALLNIRSPQHGRTRARGAAEEEPLLGESGTEDQRNLTYNWVQGTAPLAQIGGLVLLVIIWASVFSHKMIVFDGHPLLNSLAVLLAIEAVLVLQPTGFHNVEQKRNAAYIHASFVALAAVCFFSALGIVIWHKQHSHISHFETIHSKFGILTYILIVIQAFIGFTQLFVPQLYGGEENAKKLYKYHRITGYLVILPLLLVTLILATRTYYGAKVLHIKTWAVVLASLAVVLGIYPRIKVEKLRGHRQTGSH